MYRATYRPIYIHVDYSLPCHYPKQGGEKGGTLLTMAGGSAAPIRSSLVILTAILEKRRSHVQASSPTGAPIGQWRMHAPCKQTPVTVV